MNSIPQLVEVYRAGSLPEAHSVRLGLEQIGVRAYIEGESLQIAVGELPLGWHTAPKILVEQCQCQQAKEYLTNFQAHRDAVARPTFGTGSEAIECLACGAIMLDDQRRCGSCGWSFDEVPEFSDGREDRLD